MQKSKRFLTPFLSLILILSFQTQLFSQGKNMERMRSQRVAFYTEKLDLSEEEAEKFWPVYNDYISQKEKINNERSTLMRGLLSEMENMNEKEIEESHQKFIDIQSSAHKLFLQYDAKFLEILPASKVMKLYITEIQFKQFLLRQIGEQGRHRQGRNR